jgi:hypothetical protein
MESIERWGRWQLLLLQVLILTPLKLVLHLVIDKYAGLLSINIVVELWYIVARCRISNSKETAEKP